MAWSDGRAIAAATPEDTETEPAFGVNRFAALVIGCAMRSIHVTRAVAVNS